jgi:hypothetical protein
MSVHFPRKPDEPLPAYIARLEALRLRSDEDRRIRDGVIAEAKKVMRQKEGRES